MKRISSKTIAAQLVRDFDIDNPNRIINAVAEWCREALVFIGTKESFVRKECVIPYKNYKAELPHDFYKLIDLKIGDDYPEISTRSFRITSNDDANLADRRSMQSLDNLIDPPSATITKYNVENGYIYLTAENGSVGISYFAFPLDEEGDITVDISHLEAATSYCKYLYLQSRAVSGKVPYQIYKDQESRWYQQCARARGNNTMPSRGEAERLASIWNNMTPWKGIRK